MRFLRPYFLLAISFFSLLGLVPNPEAKMDFLIVNAQIAQQSGSVDALAVSGSKIMAIARSEELRSRCRSEEGCKTFDARRGFLLPGLHDSHAHPNKGGSLFYELRVSGASPSSIASSLRQYAEAHPELTWIVGRGWDAQGFHGHYPTRQDLDAGESRRPVALVDSDGHQVWANTAAIRAAGITAKTPDPEGGTIVREPNGAPAGVFLEGASGLIGAAIPEPTPESRKNYVLKGQEVGLRAGITAFSGGPMSLNMAEAYRSLSLSGEFHQRAFIWADLSVDDAGLEKWVAWDHVEKSGKVRLGAFKGFVDGVISSNTAAMLAPYSDEPANSGTPLISQERLNALVLRANRAGYPVALHSIGDRAVRMSLDAFEYSRGVLGPHGLFNRIEHIEALDPADAPRFGALGVAASMQPSHMYFGSEGSSYYPSKLGPERLKHAFAWNELAQGGALLFGTDYPVVSEDPMESFFCAIRREYRSGAPFEPFQRVTGEQALAAWSANPALAVGHGDQIGRLAVGYEADLAVFSRDPLSGQVRSAGENPPSLVLISGVDVLH